MIVHTYSDIRISEIGIFVTRRGLMVCEFDCHIEVDILARYLGCSSQIGFKYTTCKLCYYRSRIFRDQLLCLHKSCKWIFRLGHYRGLLNNHHLLHQLLLFLLLIFQLTTHAFLQFFLSRIWNNATYSILYDKNHLVSVIYLQIF